MYFSFPKEYLYLVEESDDLQLGNNTNNEIKSFRSSIDIDLEEEIDKEYADANVMISR